MSNSSFLNLRFFLDSWKARSSLLRIDLVSLSTILLTISTNVKSFAEIVSPLIVVKLSQPQHFVLVGLEYNKLLQFLHMIAIDIVLYVM